MADHGIVRKDEPWFLYFDGGRVQWVIREKRPLQENETKKRFRNLLTPCFSV
jgi:hypothetical protein